MIIFQIDEEKYDWERFAKIADHIYGKLKNTDEPYVVIPKHVLVINTSRLLDSEIAVLKDLDEEIKRILEKMENKNEWQIKEIYTMSLI